MNTHADDGWRTKAGNVGNGDRTVTVYAICLDVDDLSYKQGSPSVGGPGTASISAPCLHPGDVTVGGGLWVTGPVPETILHSSKPLDDSDPDTAQNDDWAASLAMDAEITRTFYIICSPIQ